MSPHEAGSGHGPFDNQALEAYAEALLARYRLNRRVLLIETPQFLFETFDRESIKQRAFYAYPPTGLQCIQEALAHRDLDTEILDLNFHLLKRVIEDDTFSPRRWLELLDDYLTTHDPSVIGVSCLSVSTDVSRPTFHLTQLLEHLRSLGRYVTIAGGPIATNEYAYYVQQGLCHFVVTGEGENKINALFDYLFKRKPPQAPSRGIFFKYQGRLVETDGPRDVVGLHGNLVQTYKELPIEHYHAVGSLNPFSRMAGTHRPFGCIQLNRGCRANCKFCGVGEFMGPGIRQRPIADVLAEVRYLVTERGIRHFEILDDDFLGPSWARGSLLELLGDMVTLRRRYGITWAAGNGLIASSLTGELLTLIRDSGCVGFRVGIESGNEAMLRRMRKPASLPILRRLSTLLQGVPELFVGGNYIIGLFGEETFGEMLETFQFACEINLDWAAFSTFQFTSQATSITEGLRPDGKAASDFIPAKDAKESWPAERQGIRVGPDIFGISREVVPSREQIKQIWFTFNLLANYINNRNLKPGGRPEKLRLWLEAIQLRYPGNAYMPLFAGLAYVLLGERPLAHACLERARRNLRSATGWQQLRFEPFGLVDLMDRFPQRPSQVFERLQLLQHRAREWIRQDVPEPERVLAAVSASP